MMVERVREFLEEGMALDDAVAEVRAKGVFTTHTPVPAGHDRFSTEQIDHTLNHYWEETGIDRDTFLSFGRPPGSDQDIFHMTACAMRLSRYVNGVAEKHGQVTRENWRSLWTGREPKDVPISHITNGVHLSTPGWPGGSWTCWMIIWDGAGPRESPTGFLGRRPGVGRSSPIRNPPAVEGKSLQFHQGDGTKALAGRMEGGHASRGCRDPPEPLFTDHWVRPAVCYLQEGRPDLPRRGPTPEASGQSVETGSVHLRR